MAIQDLREQIARLPEQPGVYLYYNAKGETLYVGKARSLRDRTRSYLGAYGMSPRHDALLDEAVAPRSDRHRLGGRGAGAREQPDQAALAALQHPAARRQELSLPAADHDRGVSARAGGALGRARRQRLCGPVPARQVRAPDDVADAQGVRHPVVQRGDHRHRGSGRASNTTSSAAWRRAWRRSAARSATRWRWPTRSCFSKAATRSWPISCAARMVEAAADERFEEAAQLRDAMRTVQAVRERQQKMASAELGDRDVFGVKVGAERRGGAGVPRPRRPRHRARRVRVGRRRRGRRRDREAER